MRALVVLVERFRLRSIMPVRNVTAALGACSLRRRGEDRRYGSFRPQDTGAPSCVFGQIGAEVRPVLCLGTVDVQPTRSSQLVWAVRCPAHRDARRRCAARWRGGAVHLCLFLDRACEGAKGEDRADLGKCMVRVAWGCCGGLIEAGKGSFQDGEHLPVVGVAPWPEDDEDRRVGWEGERVGCSYDEFLYEMVGSGLVEAAAAGPRFGCYPACREQVAMDLFCTWVTIFELYVVFLCCFAMEVRYVRRGGFTVIGRKRKSLF
jgi:hypothetical protein